jgi:hypothetical protein
MILTRFVAMTCVVLIIYLFIYGETKYALFVRICLTRLHGLQLHNRTRGARGWCVLVVIITDDEQLDSRT